MLANHPAHRYKDRDIAENYLAKCLKEGSLALALGAGISNGIGLPGWADLVNACCQEAIGNNPRYNNSTQNEELRKAIDRVRNSIAKANKGKTQNEVETTFRRLVRRNLYQNGQVKFQRDVHSRPLLIALAALMSGSVRGRVKDVITLNFDNVLEWYLQTYGLEVHSVCDFPTLVRATDVTLYHLHGYLPKSKKAPSIKSPLIFSKKSYDKYLAKENPQQLIWKELLTTRVMLFVGLSGDDVTFGPIFQDVKDRLQGANVHRGPRVIWLFGRKPSDDTLDELDDWGCTPVILKDFDEYPSFIFNVCRKALK